VLGKPAPPPISLELIAGFHLPQQHISHYHALPLAIYVTPRLYHGRKEFVIIRENTSLNSLQA
jgi:hypothetical protein